MHLSTPKYLQLIPGADCNCGDHNHTPVQFSPSLFACVKAGYAAEQVTAPTCVCSSWQPHYQDGRLGTEVMWCQGKQQPKAGQWLLSAIFPKSKIHQEKKKKVDMSTCWKIKEKSNALFSKIVMILFAVKNTWILLLNGIRKALLQRSETSDKTEFSCVKKSRGKLLIN